MGKKETYRTRVEVGTPLYGLYRHVLPQMVWFFSEDPGLKGDNQGVCKTGRQVDEKEGKKASS